MSPCERLFLAPPSPRGHPPIPSTPAPQRPRVASLPRAPALSSACLARGLAGRPLTPPPPRRRASFLCFLLVSRLRRLLRTRPPAALRWGARAAEQGPPWPARLPRTRFPLISSVPLVNPTFQFQSRWLTSSDRPSLLPCRPSSKPSSGVTYAFICK